MENVALVFWVCLFITVPIVALALARQQRMKRAVVGSQPHSHRARERHEPHRPRRGA